MLGVFGRLGKGSVNSRRDGKCPLRYAHMEQLQEQTPFAERQVTGEAIDQMRSGRSWFRSCCLGCGGIFVVLFVGFFLFTRILLRSHVEVVKAVPADFPKNIPLFQVDQAQVITLEEGRKKSQAMHYLTWPLRMMGDVVEAPTQEGQPVTMGKILDAYGSDVGRVDALSIEWADLPLTRDELLSEYRNALQKEGFVVEEGRFENGAEYLKGQREDATFYLGLQDLPESAKVLERVMINVSYLTHS
jgi:hypothetical protein